MISKAKTGLIHSIWEVFDIFKRFSGVGFNFPSNMDISDWIAGSFIHFICQIHLARDVAWYTLGGYKY